MDERDDRSQYTWQYPFAMPQTDRRVLAARVGPGRFPRLTGVDGRFLGAFRRFPGFKTVLDLKASPYNGGTPEWQGTSAYANLPAIDNSNLSSVWFFKYLTVQTVDPAERYPSAGIDASQKTPRVLRGYVVAHPKPDDSSRGVLRYYYYDPIEGLWVYHNLLEEVDALPSTGNADYPYRAHQIVSDGAGLLTASSQYDVAAMGPFIYFAISRTSSFAAVGTEKHDNYVARSIYLQGVGTAGASQELTSLWATTNFGPLPRFGITDVVEQTSGEIDGSVKFSVRWLSKAKNVRTPLADDQFAEAGVPAPSKFSFHLQSSTAEDTQLRGKDPFYGQNYKGVRTVPEAYRTLDSDLFSLSNGATFEAGGTLFEESEGGVDDPSSSVWDAFTNSSPSVYFTDSQEGTFGLTLIGVTTDGRLVNEPEIQFKDDSLGFAPHGLDLLLPYQGTLLRMGRIPYAGYRSEDQPVDRANVLSWGDLLTYAPEQCKVQDSIPLGDSQDEKVFALVSAGDYAFAVGDSTVYRIHRNGILLAINSLQSLAGGVGRYACCGWGSSLYYVNPTGLYAVDGATGEFQLVSALDRIIQDDWKDSLSSIRICYDNVLGALMILNDTTDEMILLWTNTGAITQLDDCQFKFCTSGIDPTTAALNRSYWISSTGLIVTPNAERTSGVALTMTGGSTSLTWNGTATSGTTTTVVMSGATFDNSLMAGSYIYFLSGDNAGTKVQISGTAGTTITLASTLVTAIAAGDRFSIAPVVFEVIGWPLVDDTSREAAEDNVFYRKKIVAMGHSLNLLGGDTDSETNPNLQILHSVYWRNSLAAPFRGFAGRTSGQMSENTTANWSSFITNTVSGLILMPSWAQFSSNVDFQLIGGQVYGRITRSGSETDPSVLYS